MGMKLVVIGGKQAGMEIPVKGPKFIIGRGEGCHLRSHSHTISRKHCLISIAENEVTIEDLGSTNGTIVNGDKILKRHPIHNGDHLTIGKLEVEVRLPSAAAETKPAEAQSAVKKSPGAKASATPNDDLEISKWLSEDSDDDSPQTIPAAKKPDADQSSLTIHDTIAGHPTDDTTTTMPVDPNPAKQKKAPISMTGRFKAPPKPKAESSRSAAEEMLRQFFPGKKP